MEKLYILVGRKQAEVQQEYQQIGLYLDEWSAKIGRSNVPLDAYDEVRILEIPVKWVY